MTLREQVEALPAWSEDDWDEDGWHRDVEAVDRAAVLDLIDAHRCIDPERLARALHAWASPDVPWQSLSDGQVLQLLADASVIAAAYEEQE